MDSRKWFIVILLLTLACVFIVAPVGKKPAFLKDIKITPGIDISGGAELTYRLLYETEQDKKDETKKPQAVIEALRERINIRGLKEPRLTTLDDDKIVIQIAVQKQEELNDYKDLLKRVGMLELKEVGGREIHRIWKEDPTKLPAGWEAIDNDQPMSGEYDYLGGPQILIRAKPVVTGKDISAASAAPTVGGGRAGGWKVHFSLHTQGEREFDKAARELFNQTPKGLIAIIMDGKIISKPVIQAEAFHGSGEITGNFDKKEATNLSITLRSGQLPVAIGALDAEGKPLAGVPESENFIGPTLAQDSLNRGIAAAAVAMAFVFLFMMIYYRGGGVLAVFSLICNVVYLLTIMAVFGATMTLPGLAGLALTIAMSVDANILILERIREEMAKGKTAIQAYEAGHDRAFSAILDGNVTTLIAAVVLYYFGTDAVQGFATVLAIGIATTMFSVLVVGKILTRLLVQSGTITQFKMMKMWDKMNVNFVRGFAAAFIVSMIAIVASVGLFAARADQALGMDFKGGIRLIFRLNQEQSIEYVRKKIDAILGPDGRPLFPNVEVSSMGKEAESAIKFQIGKSTVSRTFQLRSRAQNLEEFQQKLQEAFAQDMSHEPFDAIVLQEDGSVTLRVTEGDDTKPVPAGGYFHVYVRQVGDPEAMRAKLVELGRGIVSEDREISTDVKPALLVEKVEPAPAQLWKFKVTFAKPDVKVEAEGKLPEKFVEYRKKIKSDESIPLSESPFTAPGRIGPTAAKDLRDSTVIALFIACVLMIAYIAVRFSSWKFGVASVVALVHNAILSVGVVVVAGIVVPKSLGLSFEMNVTTVAAILTIIGYSINDTVVIFDRIRENLVLMKKETLTEILNVSVNQTMSRTILTGLSTIVTVTLLYVFTMASAGGVSEFAFPMIFGLIIGTYATIYVACPVALWLFKGQKPVISK